MERGSQVGQTWLTDSWDDANNIDLPNIAVERFTWYEMCQI